MISISVKCEKHLRGLFLGKESNHYLKWAFVEAVNAPAQYRKHPRWQSKHVTLLYERVRLRKGHSVAVRAVARHLAEATFWT